MKPPIEAPDATTGEPPAPARSPHGGASPRDTPDESSPVPFRRGPVLLVTRHRGRAARIRSLLELERFTIVQVADGDAALAISAELSPTVILVDWSAVDEPGERDDLLFRLRPRRVGPRVVAIADHQAGSSTESVRCVVDPRLDAEELVDAVWRVHNEVLDARDRSAR